MPFSRPFIHGLEGRGFDPRGSDERNVSSKRNRHLQIEYPPSSTIFLLMMLFFTLCRRMSYCYGIFILCSQSDFKIDIFLTQVARIC